MGENVKHTPGPWHIDLERPMTLGGDSREVYALTPDGRHVERQVANLMFDTDEYPDGPAYLEDVANARLIAAAPELLAACEAVAAFEPDLMFPMRPSHITPQEWRRWCACLAEIRAAVAKAKGQDAA